MAKVLASLASKYSAFQTVWDSFDKERQAINNLTERLIREEARLGGGSDVMKALAITKNRTMQVESLSGARYCVTFIDDATGFCYVYFIKHKDDVLNKLKLYESMVASPDRI